MKSEAQYRRRSDRLTWHTNPMCPKWPLKDFVEDAPQGSMGYLMICPKCKNLDAMLNDDSELDTSAGFKSLY